MDDLFIRGFDIRWNQELQDSYVYQIPAIANIDHFEFKSNITFFVGENGSGKSTFLEAFAVACGLMTKYNDDGKMQDLYARSHGESFLDFIQRADQPGLYIMDEDTESYQVTKMFLDNREYMLKRLLADDEE